MNGLNNELIRFYLNKQLFKAKRFKKDEKLSKVRQKLGLHLPEKSNFIFSDGAVVEKEDEINMEINDILDKNNNIYLINIYNQVVNNDDILETFIKNSDKSLNKEITDNIPNWLNSNFKNERQEIISQENIDININNEEKEKQDNITNNINLINSPRKPLKYIPRMIHYSDIKQKTKRNIFNKEAKKDDELIQENYDNNIDKKKGRKFPIISSCKKIEKINNLDIYLYPKFYFHNFEENKSLSFMVIGETGSGKTTLLNSFVNFLLGVNIEDEYRYKIILENTNKSQSNSQTNQVNIYNIRSVGGYPPIKIIDTPGFGDTDGIEKDQIIFDLIEKFFRENLNEINSICFVTKSTNNRLTSSQKYILNRILDIFGEDMKENFLFILTFCDGGKPNILEQLKTKECPFYDIIELSKDLNWYFKFNNSSFYESDRDDEYTKIFWKLGIKNFKDFIERLKNIPKKNLSLTKEVLKERKIENEKMDILIQKLKQGQDKIDEINKLNQTISKLNKDLNESKNYIKKTRIPLKRRINKNPNFYATTCLICNKTCCAKCNISDDDLKYKCPIMDKNGYCMICPKKCKWDQHKNRDYILEEYFEEKEIILEDLKKRYFYCENEIPIKQELLNEKKEELFIINNDCKEIQKIIYNSVEKLKNISLKKSIDSDEEFFKMLIEIEKSEHNIGWQNRIKNLEKQKEKKIILKEIYQGTYKQLNQIENFLINEC